MLDGLEREMSRSLEGFCRHFVSGAMLARGPDFVTHALLCLVPLVLRAASAVGQLPARALDKQGGPRRAVEQLGQLGLKLSRVAAFEQGGEKVSGKMIVSH